MKRQFSFACFMLFFFLFFQNLNSSEVNMQIFGHRGACGYKVENSLSSFKKALEIGVDGVELDVFKCKSSELIVIHDDKIDRVTNGKGYVENFTLDELKTFDLKNSEKIPTLNEVLDLIDKKIIVDIELKGDGTGPLVADIIKEYVLEKGWSYDNFIVTSFNHYELLDFAKHCTNVKIGPLIAGIQFGYAQFVKDMKADFIVLTKSFINQRFVDNAHEKGLPVYVYTVNDANDFEKIKSLGVDGIITDYPDLNFPSF